jgi:hypothetical protein
MKEYYMISMNYHMVTDIIAMLIVKTKSDPPDYTLPLPHIHANIHCVSAIA